MEKQSKKPISTGSLCFRITASSFAGMCFSFIAINIALILFDLFTLNPNLSFSNLIEQKDGIKALLLGAKYITLFAVEVVLLILKIIFGSKSVSKKLKPVATLSQTVMNLSESNGAFNEEKLQKLEDAIDHMDDSGVYESINTGNKELAGLEYAVNGLVQRMRDSYMQQARFVSDASHELRTPIAVIKGYADMLERWGKSDQKVLDESIDAIKSESDRMSYLVEQLLFLARGDCQRQQLNIEDFNLSDMMKEIHEEYKMIDQNHIYVLKPSENIILKGDKNLIMQCIRVLADNAVKYTPQNSKITFGAGKREDGVYFTVQDNGIGIKDSALPLIFDRFYRADDSRTNNTGGTGLGLAIAKWIVDNHNGHFEVLSREDIGTRITAVFPNE